MEKEIVICAAIKLHDGYVARGHRHSDCFRTIDGIPRYKDSKFFGCEQGFVTSLNRFVGRVEACQIQKVAGLASILPGAEGYLHGELYSEDLY
jgi:hypothetical protein